MDLIVYVMVIIKQSNELEINRRFNINYSQLCSSGTSAVTMALAVSGIGSGDEVIIPSFTFVASFEAIIMTGNSVIVDIDNINS